LVPPPATDLMSNNTRRLSVAVLLSSFCFFLAVPLIPLYIVQLGAANALAGPTIAVSFILSAVCSPLWAALANRFGPKPMLIRSAVLISAAYGLSALSTNVDLLFISRCVSGIASGFVPVATAAVVRLSEEKTRSTEMGWLSAARSAGAMLGPAVGGLLVWATGSFRVVFLLASLASLVTASLAVAMPSLPPLSSGDASSRGRVRALPVIVLPALFLTLMLTAAGMLIQLWLPFAVGHVRGAVGAAGIVGLVLAITAALAMVLAPILGRQADRRARGLVLTLTVLTPIPVVLALGLVSNIWVQIALFVIASITGSEALALLGGEVSRAVPGQVVGPYFGWSNSITQLGSAGAAAVAPSLAVVSIDLPIWVAVAISCISAILVLVLFRGIGQLLRSRDFASDLI
jgi:DHA1 family multidrug resistance protein-like MFS transporter